MAPSGTTVPQTSSVHGDHELAVIEYRQHGRLLVTWNDMYIHCAIM